MSPPRSASRYGSLAYQLPTAAPGVVERLAEVDLDASLLDRPVRGLSGGQLRRLLLARALAAEPDVLVLDEALTGLDPSLVARLVDLLLTLRERRGLSYVLISHDPRLVDHLADRVVRLERGRVVEAASRDPIHG